MKILNKQCNACALHLDLSNFGKNKGGYLGLRAKCLSCEKDRKSKQYVENREHILANKKQYAIDNKDKIRKRNTEYCKARLANDEVFKLRINVSKLIRSSLVSKGFHKVSKTQDILGCSVSKFKLHLESKFEPGMTWENRSDWHIDHICPVDQAKTEQELLAINNYINLRPLWKRLNIVKSNNKTTEGEKLCQQLLKRDWMDD